MTSRGFSSRIFHSPLGQNDRQRDIFPLPTLQCSGGMERKVSRCVQRRIQRRDHTVRQVNKAILALNSLYYGYGKAYGRVAVSDVSQLPLLQRDAINGIFDQVKSLGAPPHGACYSGALAALRVASSAYAQVEAGIGEVVNMDLKSLSLPSGKVAGVDLGVSLDGDIKEVVMNFEDRMLQEPGNWMDLQEIASSIRTYDDPLLRKRSGYLSFLKRLYDAGVLDFTSTCRGRVGAFAVSKKPKFEGGKRIDRQRLVLDCRATNLQFKPPPVTRLGSLASLGEMELPNGESLYIAGADIKDCFYGCKCPPGLMDFFCLKSDVSPDEVAIITGGNKYDFLGWHRICPCISVLPMGFNWSFYLIQALHEQISLRALGISDEWLIRDSHPPPLLHGKQAATMPYCDNVHSLSLDARACQDGVDRINGALTSSGFELHEEVNAASFFPTLGGEVDGEQGTVRPTKERVWNLILAFEFVSTSPSVSPGLIQRLLGHSMVVCVLHRAGMSVFRYLYDFVQHGDGPRPLRPSEVHECKIFAGILPLLFSDMRRQWRSTIICTDASPEGYGICSLDAGSDVARSLGRWQERWRFRRLAPEEWKPRSRASGWDPFRDASTVRGTFFEEDDLDQYISNEDFPEVPSSLLRPSRWQTVSMGRWRDTSESITIKEGRALVLAMRRMTRSQQFRGLRHVVLLDNLALCFAVGKGRCHGFALLRVLQQLSALSLSSGIILRPRWIPSESNLADGPSRAQVEPGAYRKDWGIWTGEDFSFESPQSDPSETSLVNLQNNICQEGDRQSQVEDAFTHHGKQGGASKAPEDTSYNWEDPKGGGGWLGKPCSFQQVDSIRSSKCERGNTTSVHELLGQVRGLLPGERYSLASSFGRAGCNSCGLSGHDVSGWKVPKRGRKDSGSRRVPDPSCKRVAGSLQTISERVEEDNACIQQVTASSSDHVWNRYEHGCCKTKGDVSYDGDGIFSIPSSRRSSGGAREKHRTSSQRGGPSISACDSDNPRSRRGKTRQSGCLRQLISNRSEGTTVDVNSARATCQDVEKCEGQALPFCDGGVSKSLCVSRGEVGSSRPSSVPTQARWCDRRSGKRETRLSKCQESGSVEMRPKCEEVCQDGESATSPLQAQSGESQVLQVGRDEPESSPSGCSSSKVISPLDLHRHDLLTFRPLPKKFAIEIFSGSGRVSQALCKSGIPTFPIDTCLFPSHNVLDSQVHHFLRNLIVSHRVILIWLGMPCTTFSRARRNDGRGPGPLRDSENVWGLPGLRQHDQHKLNEGNALFNFTLDIARLCYKLGIPIVIENPLTSMAWEVPSMQQFMCRKHVRTCDLDFCQYGERWKKPTRLVYFALDLQSLCKTCQGTHHKCSHSKRPHIALIGRDASGIWWTRRAQPYPFALVDSFAVLALQQLAGALKL